MKLLRGWVIAVLTFFLGGTSWSAEVLLGPGDGIKVTVYAHPDLTLETRLSEKGDIRFPLIGEVVLLGLDCASAEARIAKLLDDGGFVRKPHVNININQLSSKQVSVLGQVNRPGRYPLEEKRNFTEVIALAGGINSEGGDTAILVRQLDGKTTREVIDLAAILHAGDTAKNIELASGDVVYVERAARFYIYGEVQRPGAYRLEPQMTLAKALSLAGGLSMRGTERGARVKRLDDTGRIRIIDARQDEFIKADDVVQIQESLF